MGMIGNAPVAGTIGTGNIQDGGVTTADLAAGAVTPAKLSTGAPTWDTSGNVGFGVTPVYKAHAEGAVAAKRIGADQHIVLSADFGNVYVDSVNNANTSPMGIVFRHKISGGSLTEAVRIAPGGIAFPPTQNPSSDANTLDDYEEGTWSPTWAAGGGSATASSSGMYTKVGRLVTVNFKTTFSSASAYFNPYITNLPFPIATSINDSSGVVREYALTGLFWGLNYGSGTAVSMNRYDNSNTIPNGAPAFAGTFTYQTA